MPPLQNACHKGVITRIAGIAAEAVGGRPAALITAERGSITAPGEGIWIMVGRNTEERRRIQPREEKTLREDNNC